MLTLLDESGLDFEALRAQMDLIRTDAMAAALADGAITQEQFDLMANHPDRQGGFNRRGATGRSGGFDRRGTAGHSGGLMDQGVLSPYMHAALADALDLTVDELDALHASGASIQTLLTEQGLTFEEFGEIMTAARASALAAAVADGAISQEQADLMPDRMGPAGGRGHHGGFGH